jgi:hypothetical protein
VEFTGEVAGNQAGYSVSSAGDVNNDTYDDFLVGAFLNSDGASMAGAVYLIYGQAAPLVAASLSTAVEFTGEGVMDFAGTSVSSAGDVNNDTYDDFLVNAAFNDDGPGNDGGAAYLIYGQAAPLVSASLSTAVEFIGEAAIDYAGYTVASAGDVNNDTYDDFLVGAFMHHGYGADSGSAYFIYGQASALTSASLSTAVNFGGEAYENTAVASDDSAGSDIGNAGDVNGDGYDDFLVVANANDDGGSSSGSAYLVYGQASLLAGTSLSNAVEYIGETVSDMVNLAKTAGDVNGDGYDDFLITASFNDSGASNAGAVYLIYGQAAPLAGGSLSSVAVKYTGEGINYKAGVALAYGDINGDEYSDFLIDAASSSDGKTVVYLVYGQAAPLAGGSLSTAVALTGAPAGGYNTPVSVGDVNGDGYDDILIGNYTLNIAYLLYGQAASFVSGSYLASSVQFTPEVSGDLAGMDVALADINGDGYRDMIISATQNDDGAVNAGAIYLIYGQAAALTNASLSTAIEFMGINATASGASIGLADHCDVNNDGYDDLFIGFKDDNTTYYTLGQAAPLVGGSLSTFNTFTGEVVGDSAGDSVSCAGDVNGDNYNEIIIGATGNDDAGSGAGAAYLGYLYVDSDHDGMPGTAGILDGNDFDDNDPSVQDSWISNLSVGGSSDGWGGVLIQFTLDDPDDDDTDQARIQYSLDNGATWADPTLSTSDADTTATYGDPDINNSVAYQVGQSGAYITTSSGANTIQVRWNSAVDVPTAATQTAKIRVTPYDGTSEGTSATSSAFSLNNLESNPSDSTPSQPKVTPELTGLVISQGNGTTTGTLTEGEWTSVSWLTLGSVPYVLVSYSTDNGSTWQTLVGPIANRSNIAFTMPSDLGDTFMLKVEGTDLALVLDTLTSDPIIILEQTTTPPTSTTPVVTPPATYVPVVPVYAPSPILGYQFPTTPTDTTSATQTPAETGDEPSPILTYTSPEAASPVTGEQEEVTEVFPGDYIKSPYFPTVYYVTENMERRPFMDAQTYFTYESSFNAVKIVSDATLPLLNLAGPMLPKPSTVLVKIQSDPKVYLVSTNPDSEYRPILHWISSEELAVKMYGPQWPQYVIDIPVTLFARFEIGDKIALNPN